MGDIIDDVIQREGNGATNIVGDKGGLTYKGLSSVSNPDLFVDGLPSDSQVRQRYLERYVQGPGFDKVADEKVKSLLVDWGVNSGPIIAIKALQAICGVPQDGVLGSATLAVVATLEAGEVVKKLVAKRVQMIGRLITGNPSQAKFAAGWLNRAVEWLS